MTSFEELLARDGKLVYKTRGVSMMPMLHENRDLVFITVPQRRLRKYDVALYKRGESYVLHRVLKPEDGFYLIRGDNTYTVEKVPDDKVIGVLTGFKRKGKEYSVDHKGYRAYVRIWCAIYPLRAVYACIRRTAGRLVKRFG